MGNFAEAARAARTAVNNATVRTVFVVGHLELRIADHRVIRLVALRLKSAVLQ